MKMRYDIVVEWYDCDREIDRLAVTKLNATLAVAKRRARELLESVWYAKSEGGNIPEVARIEESATEKVVARFEWNQNFEHAEECAS